MKSDSQIKKEILGIIKNKFDIAKSENPHKEKFYIKIFDQEFKIIDVPPVMIDAQLKLLALDGLINDDIYCEDNDPGSPYPDDTIDYGFHWNFTVNNDFLKKYPNTVKKYEKDIKKTKNGAIIIFLSKTGLSTSEDKVLYEFSGIAYDMVVKLIEYKEFIMPAPQLARYVGCSMNTLSSTKRRLNREFTEKLGEEDNLIIQITKRGYEINKKYIIQKTYS